MKMFVTGGKSMKSVMGNFSEEDSTLPASEINRRIRFEFARFLNECRREITIRVTEQALDREVLELARLVVRRRKKSGSPSELNAGNLSPIGSANK
jgi:hypothetical protein